MNLLSGKQPERVWTFFEQLCSIPHGSGNTKAASQMCVRFAQEHGLTHWCDEAGNVVIVKNATPGYEAAETVILQGHLDMVCEQEPGRNFDFSNDGLDLALDGDWLYAQGTTLGGDDGIAVAMMLALLDAQTLPHPRLECVFTTDEETGMVGASALDCSRLTGRRLINLDSEEEGIFTVSCAGGVRVQCRMPVHRAPCCGAAAFRLTVGGLRGGHSGAEIDKGRACAWQLLARLMGMLQQRTPLRLVALEGGARDNVITSVATAELVLEDRADHAGALMELAARCQETFRLEYACTDPNVTVTVEPLSACTALPLSRQDTERVLALLLASPQGIERMSPDFAGLVRTSVNLGILRLDEAELNAAYLVRSSVTSEKQMLVQRLTALAGLTGCSVSLCGDYTPWEYRRDSQLRTLAVEAFRQQYGREPVVAGIHSGLECGLFCGKLPGLDAISIGPDILDIHSPRERLSLSSTERTWKLLCQILRDCR